MLLKADIPADKHVLGTGETPLLLAAAANMIGATAILVSVGADRSAEVTGGLRAGKRPTDVATKPEVLEILAEPEKSEFIIRAKMNLSTLRIPFKLAANAVAVADTVQMGVISLDKSLTAE
jgi:hypothetical protein